MSQTPLKTSDHKKDLYYALLFFGVYFIVHILFLTEFPFVHSDESWLSGYARHTLTQGFQSTEPFFIEYPRTVHGLRVVFVSLQAIFIKLLGYKLFTVRLISLCASTLLMIITSKLFKTWGFSIRDKYLSLLILGLNIQFIYASHLARQEIIILLLMVIAFGMNQKTYQPFKTACVIGLGIGVHPNSLLIALGLGFVYLMGIIKGETNWKALLKLIVLTGIFATFYITLSILMNPNFIKEYLTYGESLGVVHHNISRFEGFYYYYYKLFHQIGGTYDLMSIRIEIFLVAVTLLFGWIGYKDSKQFKIYGMLIGINLGYFIIGRYNQTAIIFSLFFTLLYWLVAIRTFKYKYYLIIGLLVIFTSISYNTLSVEYDDYSELDKHLDLEGKVLANLNLEYHFDNGQLIDYRNLWYVKDFEAFITKHDIKYIVLPEEMTYIHDTSPKWDILYGPLPYYDNMMTFLEKCELVHTFESKTYGMRIARYVNTYPWQIKIYRVSN